MVTNGPMKISDHFQQCKFDKFELLACYKAQVGSNLSGLSTTQNLNSDFFSLLIYHGSNFCGNFLKWSKFGSDFYSCSKLSRRKRNLLDSWNLALGAASNIRELVNKFSANSNTSFRGSFSSFRGV